VLKDKLGIIENIKICSEGKCSRFRLPWECCLGTSADKLWKTPVEIGLALGMSLRKTSSWKISFLARSTVDGYATGPKTPSGLPDHAAYLNFFSEVLNPRTWISCCSEQRQQDTHRGMFWKKLMLYAFEHVQIIDKHMIEVLKPAAPGENKFR
jgi:hypothetical protein